MSKGPTKDERVSGRITSRHKSLMKEYNVTVSDLCDFYFSSFGTDTKRQKIEWVCVTNRIMDMERELVGLKRQQENLEKSLGAVNVEHARKSIDSMNEELKSNRSRMRRLNKSELDELRKRRNN